MVTDIAIGVGGLGFDYRAGQIRHSVANGSLPLRSFFEAVIDDQAFKPRKMGPTTRYTRRRGTASMMKIWFLFFIVYGSLCVEHSFFLF